MNLHRALYMVQEFLEDEDSTLMESLNKCQKLTVSGFVLIRRPTERTFVCHREESFPR